MRKILVISLVIFHSLLLINFVFADTPLETKKFAVIDFENKTKSPAVGNLAASAIMVHLLKNKSCEIIDQQAINQILLEHNLKPKGIIDPVLASTIGASLGIDYIIMGNITDVGSSFRPGYWIQTAYGPMYIAPVSSSWAKLESMMIDVKTAQIVWKDVYSGSSGTTDISYAIEDAGYQTAKKVYNFAPLLGSVTKIDGEKFIINLGAVNGIAKNDLFSPVIAGNPTPLAGKEDKQNVILKVAEVSDDKCIAVIKKGKPETILPGITVSKHFKTDRGFFGGRKAEKLNQNTK